MAQNQVLEIVDGLQHYLRILVFTTTTASLNMIFFILFLVLVLLIVNVQPFKATPFAHYSKINATFFSLFIFWFITICGLEMASIIELKQFVPVFYGLAIFFFIVPFIYDSLLDLFTQ